ncbi:hypothetical protein [Nocardia aurantia]|nr:hypothetical protein [Nocardia aurantia]
MVDGFVEKLRDVILVEAVAAALLRPHTNRIAPRPSQREVRQRDWTR